MNARSRYEGGWGVFEVLVVIAIVVIVAVFIYNAVTGESGDCDFECQRALECSDEADICHHSCFPDETGSDCHNECYAAEERCNNLGPTTAVSNLASESGLTATTAKWKHHQGCSAARVGCRDRCAEEAAATSLPRPTDARGTKAFLDLLAKTQACSNACEQTFAECEDRAEGETQSKEAKE